MSSELVRNFKYQKNKNFNTFLGDEEEDVRYLSLKILKALSKEERKTLIIAAHEELAENLKKLQKILFKKLENVLKERGRAYQCLEYYIYLVSFAVKDVEMSKNQEYKTLNEGVEEKRALLEELIKAVEL